MVLFTDNNTTIIIEVSLFYYISIIVLKVPFLSISGHEMLFKESISGACTFLIEHFLHAD